VTPSLGTMLHRLHRRRFRPLEEPLRDELLSIERLEESLTPFANVEERRE
jgi:hypothetical protein